MLTSLSSRCPLRLHDLHALALRRRQRVVASARASSAGPSSRVSGVRNSWLTLVKNVGLGLVELGQPLGALALLLVGAGVGDAAASCPATRSTKPR